jgi:hypothetical protein
MGEIAGGTASVGMGGAALGVLGAGAAGYGIGTAINYGTEAATGKSASDWISDMFQSDQEKYINSQYAPTPSAGAQGKQGQTHAQVIPKKPSGSASRAISYFMSQGWTQDQAAGIAANLQEESSFNPNAIGDNGSAYGIAQWHPDRQRAFAALMGKPIQGSTFDEQLQFVQYELTKGSDVFARRAGQMLKSVNNAGQAGAVVSQFYERPGAVQEAMAKRGNMAASLSAGFTQQGGATVNSSVATDAPAAATATPATTGASSDAGAVVGAIEKQTAELKPKMKPANLTKQDQASSMNTQADLPG